MDTAILLSYLLIFFAVAAYDALFMIVPRFVLIVLALVSLFINPLFFIAGFALGYYFYRIEVYSIGDAVIIGALSAAVGSVFRSYYSPLVLGGVLIAMELILFALVRLRGRPVPVGPIAFALSALVLAWGWF